MTRRYVENIKFYPSHLNVKVVRVNKYSVDVETDDDLAVHRLNPEQRWVPHAIPDSTHPVIIGKLVTLDTWLANRLGIACGYVSNIRTFKSSKRCNGIRQIELLGLPCQWFSIGHTIEYADHQITDRYWGISFKGKILFDARGKRVILPNL